MTVESADLVVIPKECKRLAEVDFPIAVVSKHSAREKSIRHGHPSTLHLWWARRPLAACRAMLMALLLPDPCDDKCPHRFKAEARGILAGKHGRPIRWETEVKTDEGLRKTLLEFIADFSNWDNSAKADYLAVARALVKAAHPDETPLVADPFAGGGSIPLEALRLGCEAFASDLNPVACLILKVMLEDIPRHVTELAEELRRVGQEIKEKAEKELADFYPKDRDGATPIAYLWVRTVTCESPNCGAEIPLMRSFWLCKKANRKRALRYKVVRPKGDLPRVEFEIFEPTTEKEVPGGTVTRAKATCLCCNMVLPPERVRAQLAEQRGGADVIFEPSLQPSPSGTGIKAEGALRRIGGARMLALVTLQPGMQGRNYRLPTEQDYQAVWNAQRRLNAILDKWVHEGKKGLCPVPDEPLPKERQKGSSGFRVLLYGMKTFGDLFTARQKVALVTLGRLTAEAQRTHTREALAGLLSIVGGRSADYNSANCRWVPRGEYVGNTYGRQALPIVWDFNEIALFVDDATGGFAGAVDWVARVAENWRSSAPGQVQQADAGVSPLPAESVGVWFTDPPYYDAIAYADLSDFFFVWMKRTLPEHMLFHDPFDPANPLTPKRQEAIQDPARHVDGVIKNRGFYEDAMAGAFAEGRRVLREEGVGSVVFAHKTTEGWEALLSGMIRGGWTISGSWPIATEMGTRLLARESAALATSVHLVCRPR
jgi:putative DNA methylase